MSAVSLNVWRWLVAGVLWIAALALFFADAGPIWLFALLFFAGAVIAPKTGRGGRYDGDGGGGGWFGGGDGGWFDGGGFDGGGGDGGGGS